LPSVFLVAGGRPKNRPVTATVSPGVTVLGRIDNDTSLMVVGGEIVVVGKLGATLELSK
jgi:hypothetical protein